MLELHILLLTSKCNSNIEWSLPAGFYVFKAKLCICDDPIFLQTLDALVAVEPEDEADTVDTVADPTAAPVVSPVTVTEIPGEFPVFIDHSNVMESPAPFRLAPLATADWGHFAVNHVTPANSRQRPGFTPMRPQRRADRQPRHQAGPAVPAVEGIALLMDDRVLPYGLHVITPHETVEEAANVSDA